MPILPQKKKKEFHLKGPRKWTGLKEFSLKKSREKYFKLLFLFFYDYTLWASHNSTGQSWFMCALVRPGMCD
jgi:hypothetical protein